MKIDPCVLGKRVVDAIFAAGCTEEDVRHLNDPDVLELIGWVVSVKSGQIKNMAEGRIVPDGFRVVCSEMPYPRDYKQVKPVWLHNTSEVLIDGAEFLDRASKSGSAFTLLDAHLMRENLPEDVTAHLVCTGTILECIKTKEKCVPVVMHNGRGVRRAVMYMPLDQRYGREYVVPQC